MSNKIAIVGMSCRLPDADSPSAYWQNLREGRESVSRFTSEQADAAYATMATQPGWVGSVAAIENIDLFDAGFFKMPPREAELSDPQHRLFLESAWAALEDAGHGDPAAFDGLISVYAGSWQSGYASLARGHVANASDEFQLLVGNALDYLATFVSYKLGLEGESLTVQTACSTSLVAVHLACESLLSGRSDMALAGGVSIEYRQRSGYIYQPGMIFSPDGRCRPFDAAAQGTVRGYGLGIVALRRLEDAIADRDHIYATILATATNNDGRRKTGFTAPSVNAQAEVIATALSLAEVDPRSIGYVEAHGTATPLGDPIEIEALTQAWNTDESQFCAIGSAKSNLGHLVEAAGVAGLMKAALCLHHHELTPTLHYSEPNQSIDFSRSPFFVSDKNVPWTATQTPRRAAVSSFGIGGTNAHVILEEAIPATQVHADVPHVRLPFVLSAETERSLQSMRTQLARWLVERPDAPLLATAATLALGRKRFAHRWGTTAATADELREALGASMAAKITAYDQSATGDSPRWSAPSGAETALRTWLEGGEVDWAAFFEGAPWQRVPLPTYGFDRRRYWLEPREGADAYPGIIEWLKSGSNVSQPSSKASEAHLLLLDAGSEGQLRSHADTLRQACNTRGTNPGSLAVGASAAPHQGSHRLSLVFRTAQELARELGAFVDGRPGAARSSTCSPNGRHLAFVFPGHGAQWWAMGRQLLASQPVFAEAIARCDKLLSTHASWSLRAELLADEGRSRMDDMDVAQPAIFALQVALAELWKSWGVEPDGVIGNSMGEVAAAHVAGKLDLEDAVAVIFHRSRLMRECAGEGATAVIGLTPPEVQSILHDYGGGVVLAGNTGPATSLVSGDVATVERLLAFLRESQVFCQRLRVDVAAHSHFMDPVLVRLEQALAGIVPHEGRIPMYSTVHATRLDAAADASYWTRNLRAPFLFHDATAAMIRDGFRIFLQLSPHPILTHALEETLAHEGQQGRIIASLRRNTDERATMRAAVGELFLEGRDVDYLATLETSATTAERDEAVFGSSSDFEEAIRSIVSQRLAMSPSSIDPARAFVDLGVDSVCALGIVAQIKTTFGREVKVAELLTLGSVRNLAEALAANLTETVPNPSSIVPLRGDAGSSSRLCLVPGAGGTPWMLANWAEADVIQGVQVVAFNAPGHGDDSRPLLRTMQEKVDLCLAGLESSSARLILLGHSLGGLHAFLVAQALEQRGRPPLALVLAHALPPRIWNPRLFSREGGFEAVFSGLYEQFGLQGQLIDRFIEAARSDFECAERHPLEGLRSLACPVHIVSSGEDTYAPPHELRAWREFCPDAVFYDAIGGHFDFPQYAENRQLLHRLLTNILDRTSVEGEERRASARCA